MPAGAPALDGYIRAGTFFIAPMDDVSPDGDAGCVGTRSGPDCSQMERKEVYTLRIRSFSTDAYPLDEHGEVRLRVRFPIEVSLMLDGVPDPTYTAGLQMPEDGCGWKYVMTTVPGSVEPGPPGTHGTGTRAVRVDGDMDIEVHWRIEPMRTVRAVIMDGPSPFEEYCV
ncbi:MAG: hypothetical protein ABR562_07225 [Thermoplasmatota archaeon]|nr:hypothetical protein [Halobacteriales archaeon]